MSNPIKHTSQAIDNWSFDETYQQAAVEILTENVGGTALVRQKPIATEETLQIVAGLNYDTLEVDTTGGNTIIVTKKYLGNTVSSKTINII
jgi:hypothetical protein